MTKAEMVKTILIYERIAWNDLVEQQDKYGTGSGRIIPELNRWMELRNLVRDCDLEAERSKQLKEGKYNLTKEIISRLNLDIEFDQ